MSMLTTQEIISAIQRDHQRIAQLESELERMAEAAFVACNEIGGHRGATAILWDAANRARRVAAGAVLGDG